MWRKTSFLCGFQATQSDSSPMSSAIRDGSERSLPFLRFCRNFNGYGLRRASFSLKYRPIRREWCCLWLLHRHRPLPFEVFGHLRKFDITKLIFPRIWSIISHFRQLGNQKETLMVEIPTVASPSRLFEVLYQQHLSKIF